MPYYKLIADNRRARHDFEIIEVYKAGIVLKGSEVKSVRQAKVNLKGSFAKVDKGEIWLWGMHISPYSKSRIADQVPLRSRKLLLKISEMKKLAGKVTQRGCALIPLKVYFDRDWVKVDLGLCKAKKLYDKRASIKEKDERRDLQRELRRKNK